MQKQSVTYKKAYIYNHVTYKEYIGDSYNSNRNNTMCKTSIQTR